ncbi:ThiF family adenylyltransferase [Hazenella sp. IB182357]|uniref:ThiF family adenylyltransferase n=1 Tax=Polycladospora coralii TaxID=2771432 RepID=A0A926N8H7_9BACL|nr:ThiF family adenylyltransferase [Polycladospora coralii]MBS7530587.1 ThiF family adenylyltransferase [Polycladospora coralii]
MSDRYSRQERFIPIGKKGQAQLAAKRVLIIGAGALGASSAEAMVRAGIGHIILVDRDYVEWSNLQRQQLYTETDAQARIPKAIAAQTRLQSINSEVIVEAHVVDLDVSLLEDIGKEVDVIVDATDNFDTRLKINDFAQKYQIPWIYGACVGSYGISYTILPGLSPCLNCILETVPIGGATCDTAGIISPAVQMVTAHQVTEVLKLLVGDTKSLRRKLVSFDLWENQHAQLDVSKLKKLDCPSCGTNATYPHLSYENQLKTAILCGRDTVQIRPGGRSTFDIDQLKTYFTAQHIPFEENPYLLMVWVDDHRMVIFRDGRALVHGTQDIGLAKKLYHHYIG